MFNVWHAMLQRCESPSDPSYPAYGGRGIRVCARWHEFAAFRDDMGPRPPNGTLERVDVNGDYEPANCRWASAREQANNRRNNRRVEHAGETRTVAEWARHVGIPNARLVSRLKAGWPIGEALTRETRRGERRDLRAQQ